MAVWRVNKMVAGVGRGKTAVWRKGGDTKYGEDG